MNIDKDGFLVGPAQSVDEQIAEMRADVRRIREALLGPDQDATVRAVESLHQTVRTQTAAATRTAKATEVSAATVKRAPSTTAIRGADGRFVAKVSEPSRIGGRLPDVDFGRVAGAASRGASAAAEVDPAAKAVSEVAQPLGRVFGAGAEKSTKLLGRIWKWFRDSEKRTIDRGKKTDKHLKNIVDKPISVQGNGGLLSALFGRESSSGIGAAAGAFGATKLLQGLRKKPGAATAGAATGAATGAAAASKASRASAALKRVPWLGGLFGAGMGIYDYMQAKTPDEKRRSLYSTGGALGGAALGSLFGPIGAIVGGIAGQYAGEALHTYEPQIKAGYEALVLQVSDAMTAMAASVSSAWDSLKISVGDVVGPLIDRVANLVQPVKDAYDSAVSATSKGIEKTVDFVNSVQDKTSAMIGDFVDYVKQSGVGQMVGRAIEGWKLGVTSAQYESRGGVGTISSGRGDHGGVSYGTYQMSSKTGTADAYARQSRYAKQFGGAKAGSREFSAVWARIAQTDAAGFEKDQHDYIKRTHFDPAVKMLRDMGIDIAKAGPAVHDAVWSTSVQFGPAKAARMINAALGGKLGGDREAVQAIQGYKIRNNSALFSSSSASVQAGTLRRAHAELNSLTRLAAAGPNVAGASVASAAPQVQRPLTVNNNTTKTIKPDPKQDVGDRKIAQIVTGGLTNG